MPRRDSEMLLEDIRAAIARIERYTGGMTRDQFDEKTIDAVVTGGLQDAAQRHRMGTDRRSAKSDCPRLFRFGSGDHLAGLTDLAARIQATGR